MNGVSQRETQRSKIKQFLRKQSKGNEMAITDAQRVNAALGAVTVSQEEADLLKQSQEVENDFEDFEGEDESFDEDDAETFEEDEDEDFEGDDIDEDDEDEDDIDDEDLEEDFEDEDDSDLDEDDEDVIENVLSELDSAVALIGNAEDTDLSDIVECSALSQLAQLAVTENADVCTTLVDSSVLITIDASDFGAFDEFRRKQLTDVVLEGSDETVNLFATLSAKKGGYLVTPIEEVLTYHSVLAESGSTTLIGRSGELQDTVNFMETAVTRATTMLANDALGIDEDDEDSSFLIMTDEMASAYADEDEEAEIETELFEKSLLTAQDFINVSSFTSMNDAEDEAVSSATIYTHLAVRFPALTHKSTVSKGKTSKIAEQLPRLFERFQKKHPNVALRFGVTMKSTDILRTEHGKELADLLTGMGMVPYNYNEVNFTDAVFPLQSESSYDTSVANSVFNFGGDILYVMNVAQEADEE